MADTEIALTESEIWDRIDVLLHLGRAHLESGVSAHEVISAVNDSGAGLGLPGLNVTVVGTVLQVEHVTEDLRSMNRSLRSTPTDTIHCERMYRLSRTVAQIRAGELTVAEARASIEADSQPLVSSWWTLTGAAFLGFCIGLHVGGGFLTAVCAGATFFASTAAGRVAARIGLTRLYAVVLQTMFSGAIAGVLVLTGVLSPSFAVGVMAVSWVLSVLYPALIGVVVDFVNSNHLAAVAKMAQLVLVVGGIVVGAVITFALKDVVLAGPVDQIDIPTLSIAVGIVLSTLAAVSNAMAKSGGMGLLLPAAIVGLLTACRNQALINFAGIQAVWAAGLSAVVLGIGTALWSRFSDYSATILSVMGIMGALLPVMYVYEGLDQAMFHETGQHLLLQATGMIMMVGIGVVAGFQVTRFIPHRSRRSSGTAANY